MATSSSNVLEDRELLKLMYDAQLKKMLAYIAAAISSFGALLTTFFFVVGRALTLPVLPTLVLAIGLWLSSCYFAIAIVTKYQELVFLENKLGITKIHSKIYPMRSLFGKIWDKFHRKSLGIEDENYKRISRVISIGTALVLVLVTVLLAYVISQIFQFS